MKKWLIIVVSFAVTLALLLCLTPVLRELEMKLAYIEGFPPAANIKASDIDIDSYGTYGGCTVAFINPGGGSLMVTTDERVGAYVFQYNTSQQLVAYKDGAYHSLIDAYDAGWLDNDDVKKIHELHKQNFPFMYQ